MRSLVEAEAATVEIDGTTILPPTSLEASAGQMWAVTGPNGVGKSTLLRAVGGRRPLTSGRCLLVGEEVDLRRAVHRRVLAALVDPVPIARDLTVREQIGIVADSWFGRSAVATGRTSRILEELMLSGLANRFPHQVSAGQRQLFHLALVLVRPAEVVLLDEPERHLDDHHLDLVLRVVGERVRAGATFLVATHHRTVTSTCDRVLRLG
ncbi:ATP-binding cassette domain-containing protein [Cellulomonas triticagri]|uniref:ATP-binding cassette domain-containing protein n=1 Tax=Cellulomonas triticagri TaxID=2483352 RepID=A0A3M2IVL0_9CELL|nr:ATP-binding cassette domain-containing protein [Cellulomonas triticagri]